MESNKVKIKNVHGQFEVPPGYISWINYWERNMSKMAHSCQVCGCSETENLKGGHVHKHGDDENVYLVPICSNDNHYTVTGEFEVPEDMLLLVPKNDLKRKIVEEWMNEVINNQ